MATKNQDTFFEDQSRPRKAPRMKSGIPRLDDILKGGFIQGGSYYLTGPAGSGKTVLANQLCFNSIKTSDARCVYITVLVESISKMLTHIRSFSFFDGRFIPDKLFYLGAYGAAKDGGLPGLLRLIQETTQAKRPSILVIDGIQNADVGSTDARDLAEFIHELQAFTAVLGCTTIMIGQSHQNRTGYPIDTLVDGVVELSYHLVGPRGIRELNVHKFRGSAFLQGKHEVEIDDSGVQIHPRTEIQFNDPSAVATEERIRMPFNISELDQMLRGGPYSGSATVLLGAPGTGKTVLGLSFLVAGAKAGQKGIYFGFQEPPPRLIEKADAMGIDLEKHVKSGQIELIWQPPLEHFMDSLAEQLLEKIRGDRSPRRRLFVDGNEGFRAAAIYHDRMPRFLSALTNELRTYDVSTIISEELGLFKTEIDIPSPELVNVAETVILLRYIEHQSKVKRLLSILKMRESKYDSTIRELTLTDDGPMVGSPFVQTEGVLTGLGRTTSTQSFARSKAPASKGRGSGKPTGRAKGRGR